MSAAAGTAAAAAAAARAVEMQREEEQMTAYGPNDLAEGWEFKILRANTARFRDPVKLRATLDEEARGGWVLVEKFDDYRIRLKRPVKSKAVENDFADGYDPYRTTLATPHALVAIISLAAFALLVVAFFLVFSVRH